MTSFRVTHSPKKILLVQTSFLGDTILSTPVIAALKQQQPEAELWVLCTPVGAELLARDPLISGTIIYDKHRGGILAMIRLIKKIKTFKFNQAYSLHRSQRTALILYFSGIKERIGFVTAKFSWLYTVRRPRNKAMHDVLRNLALVIDHPRETDPITEIRLFAADALLQTGSKPYALIAPGSVWPTKRWRPEYFRTVAEWLIQRNFEVVLVGAADEVTVCAEVARGLKVHDLSGKTSISELLGLVRAAKLVVCNDSMVLHLASGFKIPTVTIFCATSPNFGFGPWKNRARVIEHESLPCKPCRPHGGLVCPTGTEACMRDVLPQRVVSASEDLLSA